MNHIDATCTNLLPFTTDGRSVASHRFAGYAQQVHRGAQRPRTPKKESDVSAGGSGSGGETLCTSTSGTLAANLTTFVL